MNKDKGSQTKERIQKLCTAFKEAKKAPGIKFKPHYDLGLGFFEKIMGNNKAAPFSIWNYFFLMPPLPGFAIPPLQHDTRA